MKNNWLAYFVGALMVAGGVNSCYQSYWRGYTVRTTGELFEEVAGGDLHRKHGVGVLRHDCPAIRADFALRMQQQLLAEYERESAGNISAAPIKDAVSVSVNGRSLFITYRGQSFGRPSVVALTSGDDPKSYWDDGTRILFDSVSADLGFYEPTLSLPTDKKPGPCGSAE
jgi:hypothetical protein